METAELDRVIRHLDAHRPTERTLDKLRAYVDAMVAMEPALADVAAERTVVGGVPADRLVPAGTRHDGMLLYLHGGGYALGSAVGYRPLTSRIARAFGGTTLVLDYRLAPEHPFPAGLDDVVAACAALAPTAEAGAKLVLSGDSAGGGLAIAAMTTLRDSGRPLPAAAAMFSPWVDLLGSGASLTTNAALDPIISREGMQNLAQLYLGKGDPNDPRACPTRARLEGLPPLRIDGGEREVQVDDVRAFVDKARAAGVAVDLEVWPGMVHVFPMFPVFPEAAQAIERAAAFLRSKVSST